MTFRRTALTGLLLLSSAGNSHGTHVQMFIYPNGNDINVEINSFALYHNAKFIEYKCKGSSCVKREYRLEERNGRFKIIITKKDKPADVPGGNVIRPKRLTLDCNKGTAMAEGFSSRKAAREWGMYMYEHLESNDMLDGCTPGL